MVRALVSDLVRPVIGPAWRRFHAYREARSVRQMLARLPGRLNDSPEYEAYLAAQLAHSHQRREHRAPVRIGGLVDDFLRVNPFPRDGRAVLCVGCRNALELDILARAGYQQVTGIDLFSQDRRIRQMDMHRLAFPDRSFDVLFACHALEHSFDACCVINELHRVARPDAVCVIEVPVRFTRRPGRQDLHDFVSIDGLLSSCEPMIGRVLFAEERQGEGRFARTAFVVRAPATAAC